MTTKAVMKACDTENTKYNFYNGVRFDLTSSTTSVYTTRASKSGKELRKLYKLSGAINKEADHEPFLTNVSECFDYISETIEHGA